MIAGKHVAIIPYHLIGITQDPPTLRLPFDIPVPFAELQCGTTIVEGAVRTDAVE
jgi:hypothetical protein